ncbi:MAG: hypothetical protein ACI9XP_001387 [Lentimonas sp.]|jgi:hypothetical protein
MQKLSILSFLILFTVSFSSAQIDWSKLKFELYTEVYFTQEVDENTYFKPTFPNTSNRPPFLYNYSRKNEVNLNLGLLRAKYVDSNFRAKFGLMAGTYAVSNLSDEPAGVSSIYEANIGLKLSKKANLWLDAGIFESHLGAESAIGVKNPTLSRSLLAESSPYYETGLKVGFKSKSNAWYMSAMLLNGWQRIYKAPNGEGLGLGGQITYKPTKYFELNYSNFYQKRGNIIDDFRYFSNFYGKLKFKKGTSVLVGLDYGLQRNTDWSGFLLVVQQKFKKNAVNLRLESFEDLSQTILFFPTNALGFGGRRLGGVSVGYDRYINEFATFRLESRWLNSTERVFYSLDGYSNLAFTGSLCFYLK